MNALKPRLLKATFVLVAACLPTLPQAALAQQISITAAVKELDGRWQRDGISCDAPKDSDGVAMVIKNGNFREHETDCSLSEARVTKNTLRGTLTCEGEGEEWKRELIHDRRMPDLSLDDQNYSKC